MTIKQSWWYTDIKHIQAT